MFVSGSTDGNCLIGNNLPEISGIVKLASGTDLEKSRLGIISTTDKLGILDPSISLQNGNCRDAFNLLVSTLNAYSQGTDNLFESGESFNLNETSSFTKYLVTVKGKIPEVILLEPKSPFLKSILEQKNMPGGTLDIAVTNWLFSLGITNPTKIQAAQVAITGLGITLENINPDSDGNVQVPGLVRGIYEFIKGTEINQTNPLTTQTTQEPEFNTEWDRILAGMSGEINKHAQQSGKIIETIDLLTNGLVKKPIYWQGPLGLALFTSFFESYLTNRRRKIEMQILNNSFKTLSKNILNTKFSPIWNFNPNQIKYTNQSKNPGIISTMFKNVRNSLPVIGKGLTTLSIAGLLSIVTPDFPREIGINNILNSDGNANASGNVINDGNNSKRFNEVPRAPESQDIGELRPEIITVSSLTVERDLLVDQASTGKIKKDIDFHKKLQSLNKGIKFARYLENLDQIDADRIVKLLNDSRNLIYTGNTFVNMNQVYSNLTIPGVKSTNITKFGIKLPEDNKLVQLIKNEQGLFYKNNVNSSLNNEITLRSILSYWLKISGITSPELQKIVINLILEEYKTPTSILSFEPNTDVYTGGNVSYKFMEIVNTAVEIQKAL